MSTGSTHWVAVCRCCYVFGPDEVRSFLQGRLFGAPLSSYVAVPLMLLAAVATHLTARFSLRAQRQASQAAPEAGSQAAQIASFMRWTPWIFPLGTLVGGLFFPFPIAILLYWLTSNAWTMAHQHLIARCAG